ncbi:ubiquitin carboxyl-terminal hydrolase, putative [Entamoeba dispar SAW760]|uniref:Ubiquitin carboxyl-terminal hydrolase n=1 Tax=Entamoeba dispar (strain ATCC PRA-260 / SAW760) TaxID=370354 RepID=B0E842_ENTDS|nr:ubiquitin carboxyl-terminal hydrolase, putative [Entamoeba dispar SAW760]EDR29290.1 ubiquitin carboxyl-terminal hydrolase, putative [Entamoeba dispar SAW760]|eukprot:EDR29290.1 ubiquitin carboxyl-terminal hydrolase, putative [Entamoeba dispar SAW760]
MNLYSTNPFTEFYVAISHLQKEGKFPSNYMDEIQDGTTKKYFAVPVPFVKSIHDAAVAYSSFHEEDKIEIEKLYKLPKLDTIMGLSDENGYLKGEIKEGIDYLLISKKNKKMIKRLYGFFDEDIIFPKLPKVYIYKTQKYVIKESIPIHLTITLHFIGINQTESIIERTKEVYKNITISKAIKNLQKEFQNDIKFINYEVKVMKNEEEEVENLENIVSTIIINSNELNKVNIQIIEKQTPMINSIYSYASNISSRYSGYYGIRNEEEPNGIKGVCGLHNLGNTCYMNSAIQCLIHTIPLVQFFQKEDWKKEININNPLGTSGKLVEQWYQLLIKYWSGYSTITPREFKYAIGEFAPQFSGYQQHDSQELVAYLIDGIHEDLNRVLKKPYIETPDYNNEPDNEWAIAEWNRYKQRNDSIITDLFAAQLKSKVICDVCHNINMRFDPYVFLSLAIPNKQNSVSIYVCDKKYQNTKTIKLNIKGKNIEEIIKESTKDICLNTNPNNFVIVQFGYEKKIERIIKDGKLEKDMEYGIIEKQDDESDFIVYDCLIKYASYKQYRIPVVFGKSINKEIVDEKLFELFKDTYKSKLNEWEPKINISNKKVHEEEEDNDDDDNEDDMNNNIKENQNNSILIFNNKKLENQHEEQKIEIDELKEKEEIKEKKWNFEFKEENENIIQCQSIDNGVFKYLYDRGMSYHYNQTDGDPVTLEECFETFEAEELMDENNKVYCSKCKEHQLSHKKVDLWSTNQILIIHLKRFGNSCGYSRDKITTFVDFPIESLDLTRFVKHYDPTTPPIYNLYGVTNHMGSLGGGHYVASARVGKDWYDFNDSSTSKIEGTKENIVSKNAYVLYYIRKDIDQQISINTEEFIKDENNEIQKEVIQERGNGLMKEI